MSNFGNEESMLSKSFFVKREGGRTIDRRYKAESTCGWNSGEDCGRSGRRTQDGTEDSRINIHEGVSALKQHIFKRTDQQWVNLN
jgi:hypothetical protein